MSMHRAEYLAWVKEHKLAVAIVVTAVITSVWVCAFWIIVL